MDLNEALGNLLGKKPETDARNFAYSDWLSYFRDIPAGKLMKEETRAWLRENLPVEGFAAVARWMEIIGNPSKMDKLYKGRLKAEENDNILALAVGDDEEAFYEALIVKTTKELEECTGNAQEVARLTMNLKIFRAELHEARSRKPKKDTVLAKVLELSAKPPKAPHKRNEVAKTTKKKTMTKPKKKGEKNEPPRRDHENKKQNSIAPSEKERGGKKKSA